jgi:hypothetical protein
MWPIEVLGDQRGRALDGLVSVCDGAYGKRWEREVATVAPDEDT